MEYKNIQLDLSRDKLFSPQGLILLNKYYSDGKEGVQKALARAANTFSYGDKELAQFIYEAASKHWFFYSSPILSNAIDGDWVDGSWTGPRPVAMPIACFLSYLPDSIKGQVETAAEISYLSVMGGGTAIHSQIRAVSDKAPGPIPYFKTVDGIMGYYRQGKTRRGSTAIYLQIDHPDILEFIKMRTPSGGDPARKINNRAGVHNAIAITDAFVKAVESDLLWELRCPAKGDVREVVKARWLWEQILETRELTGEPYLYFIDVANDALPVVQKERGLKNHGSNLCSEITLATNDLRTAVCCLSSLNLERYDEWKTTPLVANLVRFLDNVIQWFIDYAPPELSRAVASAKAERAIGIGAMGWHNYLMKNKIPFEGGGFNSAVQHNNIIFKKIHEQGMAATRQLAIERGEPSDLRGAGVRNSHLFAIAPNSNSSVLCNTSPSIEPILSNAYTQKSRAGIALIKNKYLEDWLDEWVESEYQRYIDMGEKYILEADFFTSFWKDVIDHNGSIQHIEWIPDNIKLLFKTAWEIDQHWVVQHAEDRQPWVCQAQSLNTFFLPGSDKAYINSVHLKAMKGRKVKSMYYFRTGAAVKADTVKVVQRQSIADWKDESVCISCEG